MKKALLAFFLFIVAAGNAFAQEEEHPPVVLCAPDLLKEVLVLGMEVIFSGVSGSGYHIVIVTDPAANWSILVTGPGDGVTCLFDTGTGATSFPGSHR